MVRDPGMDSWRSEVKAHVEILAAVVRIGPDTDAYGKPFEFAVALSAVDGHHAVLKALVSDGTLQTAHAKAAIRAVQRAGFKSVGWERKK